MKRFYCCFLFSITSVWLYAQHFECGIESFYGYSNTRFQADLAEMIGFSTLEISESDIDSAFASIDINPPRWIKELFPGIRIDIDETISRKVSRPVKGVRFFARYRFLGGSFTISDPRITTMQESKRIKNQLKSVNLSLKGDAEGLATHLAKMALADANRVEPFFSSRYDLSVQVHLKQLILGDQKLFEWGDRGAHLDAACLSGIQFTADPSAVVDLGSILFVSEKIDSLMEGGLLDPVEEITDQVATAVQNIVFGKFRDPRVVPAMGWFIRPSMIADLGGSFAVTLGGEFSTHKHLTINGAKPTISVYGFLGLQWKLFGSKS